MVWTRRLCPARAMSKGEKRALGGRPSGEARWREWRRMLDEGVYATRADLARGEGVSRAAVTRGLGRVAPRNGPGRIE